MKKISALTILCAVASQTAAANEVGFYIGGYFGQATKEVARAPLVEFTDAIHQISVFTPDEERTSLDDSDTAFGILGGYRMNRYLAFEAGYSRFGKVRYRSRAAGAFPFEDGLLNTDVTSETSGFTASVLGTLPLTRNWEVYGRAGALFATNRLSVVINAQGRDFIPPIGNHAADSFSQSTTDTYASVGVSRRILEIYDVRLEYQRVFDAGQEITGGKGDLDALMLGMTVTF